VSSILPINKNNLNKKNDPRKQKKLAATKEGVIVNNLIKGGDYGEFSGLNIPKNTYLPEDLYSKKEDILPKIKINPLIPITVAPLAILGIGVGISNMFKTLIKAKNVIPEKDQLRSIGRLITINDDNNLVLYLLIQSPNKKSLIAAASTLAAAATTFILKTVADGFNDIFLKKKKADIKRDFEEKMIEIEKRSFAGKNQISRNILADSAAKINQIMSSVSFKGYNKDTFAAFKPSSPTFKQNPEKEKEKKNILDKKWVLPVLAAGTLITSVLMARKMFKNISSLAKHMEQVATEAKSEIHKGLANVSEEELKTTLAKSKLSNELKAAIYKEWRIINGEDFIFESAPEAMGGKDNKVSFVSAVRDITAFLYTYLVNPNPQTRNLMLMVFANGALGYLGKNVVEGIKEIQVEKANAKTELELQDRLVQVELKNFMEKKASFAAPIIEDFKTLAQKHPSPEVLRQEAENALFEIKNGPPFVYS